MSKQIAVFFPTVKTQVPPYINNVDEQLNGGGLALKYGIDPLKIAAILDLKNKLPGQLNEAKLASEVTQGLNVIADKSIHDADLLNHDIGNTMQKHTDFDMADYETIGYHVVHTPPDPLTAKPVISATTVLMDMIIFDWIRKTWKGIVIYVSYDGVTWTKFDKDLKSPFEDTRKNQVVNVAETRHFKFRYLDKDDKEIGLETIVKIVAGIY